MTAECDALRNEIQRLRQEISGLNQRFIPLSEKPKIYSAIASVEDKTKTNRTSIVNLLTALATLAATVVSAVAVADKADTKASKALGGLGAVAEGLKFVIGEMRQYVTRNRFNALENRTDAIEGNLNILTRLAGVLSNRIAQNSRAISSLIERMGRAESLIRHIEFRVAELYRITNRIAGEVRILQATVELLRRLFDALERRVLAAERKIIGLLTAVAALAVAVGILQGQIAALIATVTALSATVAKLVVAVARLVLQVAANIRAIAQIKIELALLKRRINRLEKDIRQIAFKVQLALDYAKLAIEIALRRKPGSLNIDIGDIINKVIVRLTPKINAQITANIKASINIDIGDIINRVIIRLTPKINAQIIANIKASINIYLSGKMNLSPLITLINQNIQITNNIRQELAARGNGSLDISPCEPPELAPGEEAPPTEITYEGRGLAGIYGAIAAITRSLNLIHTDTKCLEAHSNNCDAVVLLPAEPYDLMDVPTQLVIKFGLEYPTATGSRWTIHIPIPIDDLNWCDHFEPLTRTVVDKKATVRWAGRQYWGNSKLWSGGYFASENEAKDFLDKMVSLSKAVPGRRSITQSLRPGGLNADHAVRAVRAVRAVVATEEGDIFCYAPPKNGC